MILDVQTEQETEKRWLAAVVNVPGASAYGRTELEAFRKALTVAYRMLAERQSCSGT